MKKICKKTKLSLILLVAMAFMLFGCGNAKDETASGETVSAENETEVVEEAEPSLEPDAEEAPEAQDAAEPDTSEEQFEDPTPTVDWETFAAQEDNDDICLVIQNVGSEMVLYSEPDSHDATFYPAEEGDRFAVPVRDSIHQIVVAKIQNLETLENNKLFLRADGVEIPPYVEIECQKGYNYNVYIQDIEGRGYQFFIANE